MGSYQALPVQWSEQAGTTRGEPGWQDFAPEVETGAMTEDIAAL